MEEVKKTGLTFIDTRRLANIAYKDIKNGFVGFGYYLKIIRDEKLWQGQGYDSFNEFLGDEYGKDKSWASRCINLYDKFGIPIEPGELPRLEEQYEVYNVSQLIEMLPMSEELREQVTPDMKIPVIRAMKPKKEKKVATVATPEQEPEPNQEPEPEPPKTEQTQLEKSGKCIHRPEFDCTLEEAHKLIPGTGEDCSRVCCWECVRRGDCELECYSSQRRPAPQLSAYGTPRREYPADSLIATEGCEGGHDCFSCSMECEIRQAERRCVGASCGNPFPCEILMNLDGIREQTGERYYRYDLEDGTSMVVKVYHARIFDGYASGSYEAKYHDGYGRHEYYMLRDGKLFRDCETNRGLLIEKLKEIQKVKKG